jgi:hypothetical protein
VLVVLSAAMAWMEAATVVYLRRLVDRLDPYQPMPLPFFEGLQETELLREAATVALLASAAWLAGSTSRQRFACFLVAFGAWDVLYYVFLAWIGPWPRSIWDWDVLFLIPLPWWGPVIAPVAIAMLMLLAGTLAAVQARPGVWPRRGAWLSASAGAFCALAAFMRDALAAAREGQAAVRAVLPTQFEWPLFLVGLALMAVPLGDLVLQLSSGYGRAAAMRRTASTSSASSSHAKLKRANGLGSPSKA